jgi:hypothetical protein
MILIKYYLETIKISVYLNNLIFITNVKGAIHNQIGNQEIFASIVEMAL